MSAPAENARSPAPVTTITLTASSAASASKQRVSSRRIPPFVARPRLEAGLEDRQQHGAVVEPQHPRGEARVVRELVESERLAELDPERLIATREEQPLAVARLIEPIGRVVSEHRLLARVIDEV